ncbi:MAG: hypothetical protein FJ271_21815 [Planctomycetes bacterium]|nr:hypothetical protein [Planctomycetota bacterium]
MRRILLCAGVNGRQKALQWLRAAVQARQPDGIFFAGGVLSEGRQYTARDGTCWGMTFDDALFVERFFATLGGLGEPPVFCAVIPGPMDTPLTDFLRMGMHAETEFPNVHLVHGCLVTERDVAVCGMGGVLCDGPACENGACSRVLAEYHLRSLWSAKQPRRALLLPTPPTGSLGGPAGRAMIGELIDSIHPALCVAAGPSATRGSQRVAGTLIVNPGELACGWAALIDWQLPLEDQVEHLDLRALGRVGCVEVGVGD